MRIVPDTNILVRASGRAAGPARELLNQIVKSPQHTLLLSPFILDELERVLSYDRVRAVTRLTDEEVQQYLGYLNEEDYVMKERVVISIDVKSESLTTNLLDCIAGFPVFVDEFLSGVNYFSRSTTIISPDDDNYKLADGSPVFLH